ncbi:MAG: TIGR00730 family Rossman fold protein [Pseudomonadota bacterium]
MSAPAPGRRRSVCVYCGSRPGADPAFTPLAQALGEGLARRGMRLVYGAGDLGLMGETARAARAAGGDVLGVIPRGLFEREAPDRRSPGVVVTENMHQRKAVMLANADAVAVLPGGIGTLDELVEAATWRQIGVHQTPIVLINAADYWTPLLALFDHMSAAGFLYEPIDALLQIAGDANEALDILERHLS